ncbi:MAG TPA: hypothetical protein VHO24_11020 [Opitutaceae bacterium]|nr:hypothetical protein [Opitutaceae bacterium]
MASSPKKHSRAKTGSTPLGKSASLLGPAAKARSNRPLQQLDAEFRRERAKLITKAELRATAGIAGETEAEWQRAALVARGDADRRRELKNEARKKLERKLGRSIPGFRAYQALKKKYFKQHGKIAGLTVVSPHLHDLSLDIGMLENPFTTEVQEFVAPFPRHQIETGDLQGALGQDNSVVLPDSGQFVQDFAFAHNESSWGASSSAVFVDHLASCGVDFTMPRDGRLQVAAEIENFSNRLHCTITDNFGFSHSYLEAWVNLFVAIVRENEPVDYYQVRLISSPLRSEGDDVERSISDLNTFEPFAIGALTLRPLPAGEKITVLAGAHIRIDSNTDDMDAHVHATYWWRLRKLQLGVV